MSVKDFVWHILDQTFDLHLAYLTMHEGNLIASAGPPPPPPSAPLNRGSEENLRDLQPKVVVIDLSELNKNIAPVVSLSGFAAISDLPYLLGVLPEVLRDAPTDTDLTETVFEALRAVSDGAEQLRASFDEMGFVGNEPGTGSGQYMPQEG